MAPQYKLTYFNITGLGESIRMLFSYGGINFVDQRVAQEDWPALKPKTPLEQIPILEVDGQVLYQSVAIARYVATLVGLTGKTPLENWEIDAAVDTVTDLRTKIFAWAFENDEAVKSKLKTTLDNETLPFLLSKLDSWAKKNGGYLATGKLTWADVYFTGNSDFLLTLYGQNLLAKYPNLIKVRENVANVPRIKAWIEKRPKS